MGKHSLTACCVLVIALSAIEVYSKSCGCSSENTLTCQKTTTFVVVGDNVTVSYTACDGVRCCCTHPVLSSAQIICPSKWKSHLPHNLDLEFWAIFSKDNVTKTNGSYTFQFRYDYNCPPEDICTGFVPSCLCHWKGIELDLQVADFSLKVQSGSLKPVTGSNLKLLCSSGLANARNIRMNFTFETENGTSMVATCSPNQTQPEYYFNDTYKWIITRMDNPPFDCTLQLVNVSSLNSGTYACIGQLPTAIPGEYRNVTSNFESVEVIEHDITLSPAVITVDPTIKPSSRNFEIDIILMAVFAGILALSAIICLIAWAVKRRGGGRGGGGLCRDHGNYEPIGDGSPEERRHLQEDTQGGSDQYGSGGEHRNDDGTSNEGSRGTPPTTSSASSTLSSEGRQFSFSMTECNGQEGNQGQNVNRQEQEVGDIMRTPGDESTGLQVPENAENYPEDEPTPREN